MVFNAVQTDVLYMLYHTIESGKNPGISLFRKKYVCILKTSHSITSLYTETVEKRICCHTKSWYHVKKIVLRPFYVIVCLYLPLSSILTKDISMAGFIMIHISFLKFLKSDKSKEGQIILEMCWFLLLEYFILMWFSV